MPTASSHGTDIYYEVYGEGERAIVFAHGMGGNAAIWFNQVACFEPDYRVLVFDHRAFGRSQCEPEQFTPARFPDDVMAVMDAAGIESAAFVCQSMGGWTGSLMAIHHRDRVDALVMSHTPGVFEHDSAVNDRDVSRLVSQPQASFASAALAEDYPRKHPAGAVLYTQISAFNNIDRAQISRAIGKANLGVNTATLEEYRIPTLFITADKDILFSASYIEALARTVPGARFVNLGDAGHSSYFELPEAFNRTVSGFLGDVST